MLPQPHTVGNCVRGTCEGYRHPRLSSKLGLKAAIHGCFQRMFKCSWERECKIRQTIFFYLEVLGRQGTSGQKYEKAEARFIEPMLLLPTRKLPQGSGWLYVVKLDGYRILAIKSRGTVQLRSRKNNDFTAQYPSIATALRALLEETVIDGEVVALDHEGRPSFNLLQNVGSSKATLVYFVFDVLILNGREVMRATLTQRRILLEEQILKQLAGPIAYSPELKANLPDLIESAKSEGLEGLIAKNCSSRCEPGQRSGPWRKMRINREQEFVIGGYTPLGESFDALIFGAFEKGKLLYMSPEHAMRRRPWWHPECFRLGSK